MINLSSRFIMNLERAFGIFGLGVICLMIYKLGPSRVALNIHIVSWGFF